MKIHTNVWMLMCEIICSQISWFSKPNRIVNQGCRQLIAWEEIHRIIKTTWVMHQITRIYPTFASIQWKMHPTHSHTLCINFELLTKESTQWNDKELMYWNRLTKIIWSKIVIFADFKALSSKYAKALRYHESDWFEHSFGRPILLKTWKKITIYSTEKNLAGKWENYLKMLNSNTKWYKKLDISNIKSISRLFCFRFFKKIGEKSLFITSDCPWLPLEFESSKAALYWMKRVKSQNIHMKHINFQMVKNQQNSDSQKRE